MTFCKPRFTKKFQYELSRFATIATFNVIGGFGKLLNNFKIKYNPDSIITYCNLNYNTGKAYKRYFEFDKNTKPNYIWTKHDILYTRYQTQKHKLHKILGDDFKPSLSEYKI